MSEIKRPQIYCPACGRYLGRHSGVIKMPLIVDCRKCNIRVVYNAEDDSMRVKTRPQRNTASGVTIY